MAYLQPKWVKTLPTIFGIDTGNGRETSVMGQRQSRDISK